MAEAVTTPPPPPGFELDAPQDFSDVKSASSSTAPTPPPPPGFQLDSAQQDERPGPVSRFAKAAWSQVNPVETVKGLYGVAKDPIGTIRQDAQARGHLGDEAAQDFKQGHYLHGAAKAAQGLVPFLGPWAADVGNDLEAGRYAEGTGKMTGFAAGAVGPSAFAGKNLRLPTGGAAQSEYIRALRPTTRDPVALKRLAKTGLENNVAVGESGMNTAEGVIDAIQPKIDAELASPQGSVRDVGPQRAQAYTDEVRTRMRSQTNPTAEVGIVDKSEADMLASHFTNPDGSSRMLTPQEAQEIKKGTYGRIYDRQKMREGEPSAAVQSQQAQARAFKDEIVDRFPALKSLNENEGAMIQLRDELQKTLVREAKKPHAANWVGTGVAGVAAGFATHNPAMGVTTAAVKTVLESPFLRSKLAIALHKASKGITIEAAKAQIAGVAQSLGQTTDDESSPLRGDQANQ